jgi:hypothetical protein
VFIVIVMFACPSWREMYFMGSLPAIKIEA